MRKNFKKISLSKLDSLYRENFSRFFFFYKCGRISIDIDKILIKYRKTFLKYCCNKIKVMAYEKTIFVIRLEILYPLHKFFNM